MRDEVFFIQWGDQQTHGLGNPLWDLYYIVISEYFPRQNSWQGNYWIYCFSLLTEAILYSFLFSSEVQEEEKEQDEVEAEVMNCFCLCMFPKNGY